MTSIFQNYVKIHPVFPKRLPLNAFVGTGQAQRSGQYHDIRDHPITADIRHLCVNDLWRQLKSQTEWKGLNAVEKYPINQAE
ncbi:hypothetical protein CEXT_428401 [Caerostris extrusa]|uniref:Uncharacterized protein n=1 Tax=Caerostris extrusa TaxID=172846 RepID=A0AAV4QU87_CAEEX|nr:hypothetical protein CEXT_428401 [Caerostris extrusa]